LRIFEMPEKAMQKYVITSPLAMPGGAVPRHVQGAGPYLQFLDKGLLPEAKFVSAIWRMTGMPAGNPPARVHVHDFDTATYYLGEPGSYEIGYNIWPPGAKPKPEEEWTSLDPANQYFIDKPALVYIPGGIYHNSFIIRVDKPPVWEVGVLLAYDKK